MSIRPAVKQLVKALIAGVKTGDADGDKWITLSNGTVVQLDKDGNVKKGMGGSQKGVPIKQAAKNMSNKSGTGASSAAASRHGAEAKTPSGVDKSSLDMRDKAALSNAGKFTSRKNAEHMRDNQKYRTNILKGENGQLWVPSTNREESILKRLGYSEAK